MKQSELETVVIVPDTHRPYHDPQAWSLFLKAARMLKPKHLVIIGDFCDFYAVSSHSKDPQRTTMLDAEIKDVKVGLDELDSLGAKNKLFVAGNHCDRLNRYLRDRAPELYTLVGGVPELLGLRERGWRYTPYKESARIGKVWFTHDVGTAGRYASFKVMDTFQHSAVTGHAHRLQYIVEGNALAECKLSAQFGWLGDASKVDYMHRVSVNKNWALGFGHGVIDRSTGIGYLTPVPIIPVRRQYTCVVNGKLLSV